MAPSDDLHITATPTSFYAGLTRRLSVSCAFPGGPDADISDVMSLIMSKTSSDGAVLTEIAAVTSHDPGHIDVKPPAHNATVSGQLRPQGPASLSITWLRPQGDVAGSFRCQLFGMDLQGHPRVSTAETSVESLDDITSDLLVKEIKELQNSHDQLAKSNSDLNSKVTELEEFKVNTTQAVFQASATFGGHTYFLSRPFMRDIANHYAMCTAFQGYLLEIDTKAEYDFIYDWAVVKQGVDKVAIGSSDAVSDGQWSYIRTGRPMTYNHKMDGNGPTSNNVLEIWSEYHGMVDEPPQGMNNRRQLLGRFICEIPY